MSKAVLEDPTLELAFVWNRTKETLESSDIPKNLILDDLKKCGDFKPDLIVEVAHPKITNEVLLKILCNLPNRSEFGIILKKTRSDKLILQWRLF